MKNKWKWIILGLVVLYNERFHMLDKDQSGRVTEFSIQRSGTGANQRAAPRQRALPLGCPR